MNEVTRPEMAAVVRLAELALQFGRVDRVTFHPDGRTPESDTDHTVMLSLVACAWAAKHTDLDVGLVAQFAAVHDLPEALCGDTDTLRIDEAGRASKEDRERIATDQIAASTKELPWVSEIMRRYEAQDTREARFVRVVDKVLPKLAHALNGGATLRGRNLDLASLAEVNGSQREKIGKTYGADQPEAMALLLACHEELVRCLELYEDKRCFTPGCGQPKEINNPLRCPECQEAWDLEVYGED